MVKMCDPYALRNKTEIRYNSTKLKDILYQYQYERDFRYKILPIETIKTIRNLRLNARRRRHKYTAQKRLDTKLKLKQIHGLGPENLTKIKRKGHRDNTNIIIGTANIQSIQNKDLQVSDLIEDYTINILIIMETWLSKSERDNQWLETTPLNRQPYRFLTQNRTTGKGGGLALITKYCYKVRRVNSGSYSSFEHATWEVMVRKKPVYFTGIYHPPPTHLGLSLLTEPSWMTSQTL